MTSRYARADDVIHYKMTVSELEHVHGWAGGKEHMFLPDNTTALSHALTDASLFTTTMREVD